MTKISRALEPIQPFIGGEPVSCIGLVLSGATKDFICDKPLLDDLFGIARRRDHDADTPGNAGPDDLFGHAERKNIVLKNVILHAEADTLRGDGLADNFMISGEFMPETAADDADILTTTTYNEAPTGKRFSAQGLIPPEQRMVTRPVIMARNHGSGRAIAVRCAVGKGYAEQPHRRTREVVRRLLATHIEPGFATDAPANVVATPWRGDRLAVHLLQAPSALLRFTNDTPGLDDLYWPEDFPALADVNLTVPGEWKTVHAPTAPDSITTQTKHGATTVTVRGLQTHHVIVFDK